MHLIRGTRSPEREEIERQAEAFELAHMRRLARVRFAGVMAAIIAALVFLSVLA